MWETKVDVDWKKAKIKSPHIVFLNDQEVFIDLYHLSLAILWYFLTHKVCWYSLPIHLYSNSPWQLANKSELFFQYFRSAHMSYLADNLVNTCITTLMILVWGGGGCCMDWGKKHEVDNQTCKLCACAVHCTTMQASLKSPTPIIIS